MRWAGPWTAWELKEAIAIHSAIPAEEQRLLVGPPEGRLAMGNGRVRVLGFGKEPGGCLKEGHGLGMNGALLEGSHRGWARGGHSNSLPAENQQDGMSRWHPEAGNVQLAWLGWVN